MDTIYRGLDQSQGSSMSGSDLNSSATEPPPHVRMDARELALWRWANVTNIDLFLSSAYEFYLDKGFYCILLKRVLNMLTILFVVVFSTYLTNCIDFAHLAGARTLADIRVEHCLAKTSFLTKLWLWVFGVLWLLRLFQYAAEVPQLLELKAFYEHILQVSDNELQTISWQQIVGRIVQLQDVNFKAKGHGTVLLDPHNIANRIMRRENYLISLYSKNVFDLEIILPIFGKSEFLTKTLEWSINLCVLDFVFNSAGTIRPVFLDKNNHIRLVEGLKRRFQFVAIMNIILIPFAILYMSLYYFFKYFNEYHKDPSAMGTRTYTPLAEWKMRELNELYHLFKRRMSMSTLPASRYISQFPREKMDIFLRFVIFIFSSFAAVLGMLSIYDPELLGLELSPDKSVLFFIGIFGTIIAVSRGMAAHESVIYDPETAMRQIIEFTHYFPDSWQGELHTDKVKAKFCTLYDLKIKVLLFDFLSIFLNPIILWYNLPDSCDKIISFFREFTAEVDGVGHVCSFAVFNFDEVQKVRSRAEELDRYYASTDGKMLKSYLNFMDAYGPDVRGRPQDPDFTDAPPVVQDHTQDHNQAPNTTTSTPIQSKIHSVPFSPPFTTVTQWQSTDMSQSVMGRYSKIQRLSSVQEEDQSHGSPASSTGNLLDCLEESSGQIPDTDQGVFGLLNKISKLQGGRDPLH